MRPLALAVLAAASLVAACTRVTRVHGPDGTDRWYDVHCTGDRSGCYDAAAEQCPGGYVIADSASGSSSWTSSSVSHGATVVSGGSTSTGDLLIQCKVDQAVEGEPTNGVRREEEREARLAPTRDTADCEALYRRVDDVAALWAEWFHGTAVAKAPRSSAFLRVCTLLDDDTQTCLAPAYARSHHDVCAQRFDALPQATRDKLDGLLLAPAE